MKTNQTANWRSGPALMMACGLAALTSPATAGKPPKDPLPPPEPPPVTFTIVSAGHAGDADDETHPCAINDNGAIVGGFLSIEFVRKDPWFGPLYNYVYRAFLLEPVDGVYFRDDDGDGANDLIQLLTPSANPDDWSWAVDINNHGQIIGQQKLANNPTALATVWDGGQIVFEMPGVRFFDINDAGVIAGTNTGTDVVFVIVPLDADLDGRPDIWHTDADGDGFNDLLYVVDQGYGVEPVGVFDDLSVIWGAQGNFPPFVIRPDFTDADGDGNPWYADTDGDGVNDRCETFEVRGWIKSITGAGYAVGNAGRDAALFDTNTLTFHDLDWVDTSGRGPSGSADAYGVNDAAWVIGAESDSKDRVTPVLWMDGVKWDFRELSSFTGMPWLRCINQNGVIVGNNGALTEFYVAIPSQSP